MVQFPPMARIHRSSNQGLEKGIVSLTIAPNDPLGIFLLPVLPTLSPADLRVLVPEEEVFLSGATTNIPLHWKLRLLLFTLGFSPLKLAG